MAKRKKFLRRNSEKYSRLGKGRKKLQKWRRPRGRHGKMRERRKGYPGRPEVGLINPNKKIIKLIRNMNELAKIKKGEGIVIASVGKKKRSEMMKKADEMGIKILNSGNKVPDEAGRLSGR